jgi:hypothetical protein
MPESQNFENRRLQIRIVVISRGSSSNVRDKIERLYSSVLISSLEREHVITRRVKDGTSTLFEHDSVFHSLGCFRYVLTRALACPVWQ